MNQNFPLMPRSHLVFIASDMAVRERAFFEEGCLRIDHDGRGWIDPRSEPIDRESCFAQLRYKKLAGLILERSEDGFRVDLRLSARPRWRRDQKPEPVRGLDWIPVVEFQATV